MARAQAAARVASLLVVCAQVSCAGEAAERDAAPIDASSADAAKVDAAKPDPPSSPTDAGPEAPTCVNLALPFASGSTAAERLALSATHVYWSEIGIEWSIEPGAPLECHGASIRRKAKTGGGIEWVSKDVLCRPLRLVVDDAFAYWSDRFAFPSPPSGISRAPLDGGATTLLIQGAPKDFAIDAGVLYWAADGGVGIVTPPEPGWAPLDTAAPTLRVRVFGDYVYTTTTTDLRRVAKAGGTPEVLAKLVARDFDVYGDDIYAVGEHSVVRVAAGAQQPTKLVSGLVNGGVLATDGEDVYFTDRGSGAWNGNETVYPEGAVKRVSVSGGAVTTIASCLHNVGDLVVDDQAVYFTAGLVYRLK